MTFEPGQKLGIPGKGLPEWVAVDFAQAVAQGWRLYVKDDSDGITRVDLTAKDAAGIVVLTEDGGASATWVFFNRMRPLNAAHVSATACGASEIEGQPSERFPGCD